MHVYSVHVWGCGCAGVQVWVWVCGCMWYVQVWGCAVQVCGMCRYVGVQCVGVECVGVGVGVWSTWPSRPSDGLRKLFW